MTKRKKRPFGKVERHREPPRRKLLLQGLGLMVGGAAFALARRRWGPRPPKLRLAKGAVPVRPPGTAPTEAEFLDACIRCGLCGTACKSGCIRFFGLDESEHGALSPYLDVRSRSCILCMACTDICPTGALKPIPEQLDVIKKEVRMGVAKVDADLCISYLGRICGYCHDACPLPGIAIELAPPASPVVLEDGCVGCGRCAEFCPQYPTAIDVVRRDPMGGQ